MRFSYLTFYIVPLTIVFFSSCNTSKKVQSIETTKSNPEIVVETKAAIIGGLAALQNELDYPRKAREKGVETILKANILVNKKGEIERISFDKKTEYGFEKAARSALHRVQFKAGERNGVPINMFITIPVKFEL
jgi:TonB family protein